MERPGKEVISVMELEIHCPIHGTSETLELPDHYKDFEGEVVCPTPVNAPGSGDGKARLRLKIIDGLLISVDAVMADSAYSNLAEKGAEKPIERGDSLMTKIEKKMRSKYERGPRGSR